MNLIIKDHKIGVDFYESKEALFKSFFGKFYEFILNHDGKGDLEKHNIHNVEDFYAFADWNAGGMDNCYAIGFAFNKYYLKPKIGSTIDEQPETTFIGYCHKNHLFDDFIGFLITYFAWWRNDEGCTKFNPYNYSDDFFASGWATLVDTCKMFYLNAETVPVWLSIRIKYCVDNIPGVILHMPKDENERMRVAGYEFTGYTKEGDKTIANFIRKDYYDYWGKEEPNIVKVITPESKIVDPE